MKGISFNRVLNRTVISIETITLPLALVIQAIEKAPCLIGKGLIFAFQWDPLGIERNEKHLQALFLWDFNPFASHKELTDI